jgi:hypothetical protein
VLGDRGDKGFIWLVGFGSVKAILFLEPHAICLSYAININISILPLMITLPLQVPHLTSSLPAWVTIWRAYRYVTQNP